MQPYDENIFLKKLFQKLFWSKDHVWYLAARKPNKLDLIVRN